MFKLNGNYKQLNKFPNRYTTDPQTKNHFKKNNCFNTKQK